MARDSYVKTRLPGRLLYSGAKIRAFDDTSNGTRYGYSYDDNGRLIRATAVPSGSGSAVAQNFDEAYGFTADQWPAGATFGNVQRVTTFGADGSSLSRDYDHADDRVTAIRIGTAVEKSLQYDDAGRVTLVTTGTSSRQTSYDVEDHLTAITPSSGPGESLAYDPTGTLMFRRVGTRVYYYTGSMTITGDVSASCVGYGCTASNVKVEVHIVAGAARLASIRAPAPSSPAAIDSDILYYHHDRQGSVVATTRNGGLIGERYRYTPYGALDKAEVVSTNAHSDVAYLGGTQLSGSLLHLGARAYDPELRRFLQPDIVDLLRYGYGAGDPRNMMDPSGYMPISEEQQVNSAQIANLYGRGYDVFQAANLFNAPLDQLPASIRNAEMGRIEARQNERVQAWTAASASFGSSRAEVQCGGYGTIDCPPGIPDGTWLPGATQYAPPSPYWNAGAIAFAIAVAPADAASTLSSEVIYRRAGGKARSLGVQALKSVVQGVGLAAVTLIATSMGSGVIATAAAVSIGSGLVNVAISVAAARYMREPYSMKQALFDFGVGASSAKLTGLLAAGKAGVAALKEPAVKAVLGIYGFASTLAAAPLEAQLLP